jgi:hypothetical protein
MLAPIGRLRQQAAGVVIRVIFALLGLGLTNGA